MSDLNEERRQLLQEMKVTKGSRFNATERLRKRDRGRTYITSIASVLVIALSILPLVFHLPDNLVAAVNFSVIIMSVTFLAFSLLQYSSGDPVTADQHHRCALEINALRRKLRMAESVDWNTLRDYASRYDDILQRYSSNHEPVDFERYKLEHPTEYPANEEVNARAKKDVRSALFAEQGLQVILTVFAAGVVLAIVTEVLLDFYKSHVVSRLMQSLPLMGN